MEIEQVLDNALRKAAAVWVTPSGHRPRLVWALWRDGAVLVAVGGAEQDVPGLADGVACTVTVRSPTTRSHLVDAPATARLVGSGDAGSGGAGSGDVGSGSAGTGGAGLDHEAVAALRATRLNGRPEWESVYRLEFR